MLVENTVHATLDKSWEALRNPGNAQDFFYGSTPQINPNLQGFSNSHAWTFSEISRLIYRSDSTEHENQATAPTRSELFAAAGFQEIRSISQESIQCAILHHSESQSQILVFRGTQDLQNWLTNLDTAPIKFPHGGRIHRGFSQALDSILGELIAELRQHQGPLFITGHSLGGALAVAAAAQPEITATAVYTFGSPRVGNPEFNSCLEKTPTYRVVLMSDLVTQVPPWQLGFKHSGILHHINNRGELLVDPPRTTRYADFLGSMLDFKDLGNQFQTLAPHQMLYLHSPINYSRTLRKFL